MCSPSPPKPKPAPRPLAPPPEISIAGSEDNLAASKRKATGKKQLRLDTGGSKSGLGIPL